MTAHRRADIAPWALTLLITLGGCDSRTLGSRFTDAGPSPGADAGGCGDGVCAPSESTASCPIDCPAAPCYPGSTGGAVLDSIANVVEMPLTSAEARSVGADLDGDGEIDNKLGSLCSLLSSTGDGDPTEALAMALYMGTVRIGLRVYVDSFPDDDRVFAQTLPGVPGGPPPRFDGDDVVEIDPETPMDRGICGPLSAHTLSAGPGHLFAPVPFCFPVAHAIPVTLEEARLQGRLSPEGGQGLVLSGAVSTEEMAQRVYPALLDALNTLMETDPNGAAAQTYRDLLDGNCDPSLQGCADVLPGQGECAQGGPPWLTLTELRCNALLDAAFAPDVDLDGDGVNDHLSVGYRLSTTRASLIEVWE